MKRTLYETEFDAHIEREFRPWRCLRIFLIRCVILFVELCILTALLYWANHVFGIASWIRICTAVALLCWGGFAWAALKMLIDVWIRARWIALVAKCFIVAALLILIDVALGITYHASVG